jgi:hypothetical protein
MALAYRRDAISQGPKNSTFPGPNPLPHALVMDMHSSKTLCTGLYKSKVHIQLLFPDLAVIKKISNDRYIFSHKNFLFPCDKKTYSRLLHSIWYWYNGATIKCIVSQTIYFLSTDSSWKKSCAWEWGLFDLDDRDPTFLLYHKETQAPWLTFRQSKLC